MIANSQFKNWKIDEDIRKWKAAKAMKPKNHFPNAGHLGEMLSDQIHQAQAATHVDEMPIPTQAEMLSTLLVCHEMLADSMRQLTETMSAVMAQQKDQTHES